jgi:serine/threonine protein kinase
MNPHTILVDAYNRCKLTDFGLSQQNGASTQFVGSIAFLAPRFRSVRCGRVGGRGGVLLDCVRLQSVSAE